MIRRLVQAAVAAAAMIAFGASAATAESEAASNSVTFTWSGQQTYYYCGPAATQIALSARMSPPGQDEIAAQLGTTENGTDSISQVADGLNHYLGGSHYTYTNITDPPGSGQQDALEADIVSDIDSGYALVANVVSGWRPPGYPSGTIYHYVAIVGYSAGGDQVRIADPAGDGSGGSSWDDVPQTYDVSIGDLAVWIGSKGYAH